MQKAGRNERKQHILPREKEAKNSLKKNTVRQSSLAACVMKMTDWLRFLCFRLIVHASIFFFFNFLTYIRVWFTVAKTVPGAALAGILSSQDTAPQGSVWHDSGHEGDLKPLDARIKENGQVVIEVKGRCCVCVVVACVLVLSRHQKSCCYSLCLLHFYKMEFYNQILAGYHTQ